MDAESPTALGRRRRWSRRVWVHLTGAFAVVVLSAAFTVWAIVERPEETSVLIMASPLAAGETIEQSHLDGVTIGAEHAAGLGLISASRSHEVIGKAAAVPLRAGTLLSTEMIGAPVVPRAGFVEVTIALADGRWPTRVQAGQAVSLIAESTTIAEGVWSSPATVLAIELPEVGGALVTVELPAESAPGLATAEPSTLFMLTTAPAPTPLHEDAAASETTDTEAAGGED
jgi:hypothetical protein